MRSKPPRCMRNLARLAHVALSIVILGPALSVSSRADPSPGEHIYRTGRTLNDRTISAMLADGTVVDATQLPCVTCHQPSGFGTSEGDTTAPPITWAALESPRSKNLRMPYRSRSLEGRSRTGYDENSFALAIRLGLDPEGRELDPAMPRYALDDESMRAIVSHLRELSATHVPGLSATEIHFSTIITPGTGKERGEALVDVLKNFFDDKNSETRNDSGRARRGPFYRDTTQRAFRKWILHVWRLEGPPSTWVEQLDAFRLAQPVFAIAGGVISGSWKPIGEFCEKNRIPCVLAGTNLPDLSSDQRYSFHFSKSLALEAELLTAHLRKRAVSSDTQIVQYFVEGEDGESAARIATEVLKNAGFESVDSRPISIPGSQSILASTGTEDSIHVAWLTRGTLIRFAEGTEEASLDLYVSGTLLNSATEPVPTTIGEAWMLHPFELADKIRRTTIRGRAWIAKKGITREPTQTHLDTYLTALVLHDGIKHMRTNFSREYFMERIEHAMDSAAYRSVYPRLSSGPGQRFASKTGNVVRIGQTEKAQSP